MRRYALYRVPVLVIYCVLIVVRYFRSFSWAVSVVKMERNVDPDQFLLFLL